MRSVKFERVNCLCHSHGATKGIAEEIVRVLREENIDVKVVNAKEDKVRDILEYRLVVVGSGMALGNWVNEAEDFLKKFQEDFENRKLALFISSLKPVEEKAGKTARVDRTRKIGLEDKILKYHLKPIMIRFFGGILDCNKMSFLTRKAMEVGYKSQRRPDSKRVSLAFTICAIGMRSVVGLGNLLKKLRSN